MIGVPRWLSLAFSKQPWIAIIESVRDLLGELHLRREVSCKSSIAALLTDKSRPHLSLRKDRLLGCEQALRFIDTKAFVYRGKACLYALSDCKSLFKISDSVLDTSSFYPAHSTVE